MLRADAAQPLSLVLHEHASNSAKHGVLSPLGDSSGSSGASHPVATWNSAGLNVAGLKSLGRRAAQASSPGLS